MDQIYLDCVALDRNSIWFIFAKKIWEASFIFNVNQSPISNCTRWKSNQLGSEVTDNNQQLHKEIFI